MGAEPACSTNKNKICHRTRYKATFICLLFIRQIKISFKNNLIEYTIWEISSTNQFTDFLCLCLPIQNVNWRRHVKLTYSFTSVWNMPIAGAHSSGTKRRVQHVALIGGQSKKCGLPPRKKGPSFSAPTTSCPRGLDFADTAVRTSNLAYLSSKGRKHFEVPYMVKLLRTSWRRMEEYRYSSTNF